MLLDPQNKYQMEKKHPLFQERYWEQISISPLIWSATDKIHMIRIETAVLPDHLPKLMSQSLITSEGLLNAPGPSNANEENG